jgi:hypothetical protein
MTDDEKARQHAVEIELIRAAAAIAETGMALVATSNSVVPLLDAASKFLMEYWEESICTMLEEQTAGMPDPLEE